MFHVYFPIGVTSQRFTKEIGINFIIPFAGVETKSIFIFCFTLSLFYRPNFCMGSFRVLAHFDNFLILKGMLCDVSERSQLRFSSPSVLIPFLIVPIYIHVKIYLDKHLLSQNLSQFSFASDPNERPHDVVDDSLT